MVNLSSLHDTETDVDVLVCSAYGGIPDKHNITLSYSGQQGLNVSGNSLQILLGEYLCTVDSLYNTTTVTVMSSIRDKGIHLSLFMSIMHKKYDIVSRVYIYNTLDCMYI